jgi:hypothetical protein
MWEVFTEGKMPFENKSNLQVVEAISKGFRLYRPHLAPMSIYEVMYSCWHAVGVPSLPGWQPQHLRTNLIVTSNHSGLCHGSKSCLFLSNDLRTRSTVN